MFPNSIRGRAMSLATFGLWTANFIVSQTFPMMDKNPWLISRFNHGFPFYVYAAFCVVLVVVVWLGVPETKGRSLEEIETHWIQGRS
jgi:SP family xylose:H+ symportor-like MFS transporter